ncbi:hypothetical protein [Marivirga sericea]|uniref:hypothetical protein n=1 Tax=Marivirga sericea TaxID=1028 RepID=UPI0015940D1A|nr:hypothetical protein [Marivirga sericea]
MPLITVIANPFRVKQSNACYSYHKIASYPAGWADKLAMTHLTNLPVMHEADVQCL